MNTNDFLEKMKSLLDGDPDAKIQFDDIYEPRSVAVVPEDAWRSLFVTKDGYIRYYGRYFDGRKEEYPECYIESRDCGVSVVLPNGKTGSRPLPILPTGISYLHLQIAATDNAEVGVYVSHLSFKAE